MKRNERLGVIGSRTISDPELVGESLSRYRESVSCVLVGGALGADTLTANWCEKEDVPVILFKPYFMLDPQASYSVRHYFTRNKQIIDNSDRVLAFWDGNSPGTKWGINYARKRGKQLEVIDGRTNQTGIEGSTVHGSDSDTDGT